MPDSFQESAVTTYYSSLRKMLERLQFSDKEQQVLGFFYDERLKVRRELVPKFYLYARVCDGKSQDSWPQLMIDVDKALRNLVELGYVQKVKPSTVGSMVPNFVGQGGDLHELTVRGFETLQAWHPPITLKLRAWIAVMPPWLVLIGSVAGAIGALWKLTELVMLFVERAS